MGDFKGLTNNLKYSKKTGINLARREYDKKSSVIFLIGLVVIGCLSAAIAKFGVIDQYARLSRAEAEYNRIHEQNMSLTNKIAEYSKVQLEYRTYATEWMDESYVERRLILDVIEEELMPCGHISIVVIRGNTANISISDMSLEEVSHMVTALDGRSEVSHVELNEAQMDGRTTDDPEFKLTVVFANVTEGK